MERIDSREAFVSRSARLAATLACVACLASCSWFHGPERTGRVSIRATEAVPRAGLHDPAPPVGSLVVSVSGDGPGAAALAETPLAGGSLELDLAAGPWTFQAVARDTGGAVCLSGSSAAVVDPALGATVAIVTTPVPGIGRTVLEYDAPDDASPEATWSGRLETASGEPVAAWTDGLEATGRTIEDLASGYYLLELGIMDDGIALGGRTDVLRILAGRTTTVALSVTIAQAGATLDVVMVDRGPFAVGAAFLSWDLVRGFPLLAEADGPADGRYVWSSGPARLAEGRTALLPTAHLTATGSVDLYSFADGAAGGVSLPYSLSEPVVDGEWGRYTALSATDCPEAPALASPAMAASSADGTVTVVASDATGSRVDVWHTCAATPDPAFAASSTVRIGGSLRKATMLAVSPDGRYAGLANADSGWAWIAGLEGGNFDIAELQDDGGNLSGMGYVRGLAFAPDSGWLYLLSNANRALYAFQREGSAWVFASRTDLDGLPCGALSTLKGLALSSDGTVAAIAAAGSDAVAILDLAGATVTWRGQAVLGPTFPLLDYPTTLAFRPGSLVLAIGARDSSALVVLDCSAVGDPVPMAALAAADGMPEGGPSSLAWSPPGAELAVAGTGTLALVDAGVPASPALAARFDMATIPELTGSGSVAYTARYLAAVFPASAAMTLFGHPDP